MATSVLLYGADEFIGRLVAWHSAWAEPGAPKLVLAGRNDAALATLAAALGAQARIFDWRNEAQLDAGLANVDVVLNAATPFEETMPAIVAAALRKGCNYLDLNTEIDVERNFDLFRNGAQVKGLSLVCSAGPSAALSSLLVDAALDSLRANGVIAPQANLGALRLAVSCVAGASRASAASVWRALGRDVAVGLVDSPAPGLLAVDYQSRPIGQLERSFNFGIGAVAAPRLCSAASLTDLHAAGRVACAKGHKVATIETYVAATTASRIAYPLGAAWRTISAPVYSYDTVESLALLGFRLLPAGPEAALRQAEPYQIVLQVEDMLLQTVLDWRLRCPNLYDVSAQLAARMAIALAQGANPGILRPSDLVNAPMAPADPIDGLSGLALDRRLN